MSAERVARLVANRSVSALLTIAQRDDDAEKGRDFPEVLLDQIKRLREQLDEEELTGPRDVWAQAGRPAAHPGQITFGTRAAQRFVPPSVHDDGYRSAPRGISPQARFKKASPNGNDPLARADDLPPLLRIREMPHGAARQ